MNVAVAQKSNLLTNNVAKRIEPHPKGLAESVELCHDNEADRVDTITNSQKRCGVYANEDGIKLCWMGELLTNNFPTYYGMMVARFHRRGSSKPAA